jgi:hypothetical protein
MDIRCGQLDAASRLPVLQPGCLQEPDKIDAAKLGAVAAKKKKNKRGRDELTDQHEVRCLCCTPADF